jgi:hypothetical protein
MNRSKPSKNTYGLTLAGSLFLLVIVTLVMVLGKGMSEKPNRPPGFRDVALESGINFRMSFLPNEQGESFKIN